MPPDPDTWLTIKEVCDLLQTSPSAIRRMLKNGTLVGLHVGFHESWRIMHPGDQFMQYIREADNHLEMR